MEFENPFLVKGYTEVELFCDREQELEALLSNVKNGRDTTLLSERRIGKTGLIFRFFDYVSNKKITTIYVDIFNSRSLSDFVKLLVEAVLSKYGEKTSFGKMFLNFIKGFRPLISFDPITSYPQVQLAYQSNAEKQWTLKSILDFLEKQNKTVVIAIDEFQQITEYPEKNIEALLRTYIQGLKNTRFIFCGSKSTIMANMFLNAKRPFFNSTSCLSLNKIDKNKYSAFIKNLFKKYRKKIDDESVNFILDWTLGHTYYTQYLCNNVFANSGKEINLSVVKRACADIMWQHDSQFSQYRQMLTYAQWNFLIALAKEERVEHLTAQEFLFNYKIGTPSNAKRITKSLMEKELILAKSDSKTTFYSVYDVFLMRWLQHTY